MTFEYQTAMSMPFGSAALRPQEVVSLFSTRWAYFPALSASLDVCAAGTLEAYKIADAVNINQRRLTQALAVAFVLSLAFGIWVTLTGCPPQKPYPDDLTALRRVSLLRNIRSQPSLQEVKNASH